MRKILTTMVLLAVFTVSALAKEGMWIPILLQKYNIEEMQEMGFRLTAEDIYSVNQACMKDAVVIFGGGCTGELISNEGLLITNHHCGFDAIQKHSSVEHDYLTDGFWAKSRDEELINPDLTVTFMKRMEDVTAKVMEGVSDSMNMADKDDIIKKNIKNIIEEATKDNHYKALVKSFFHGNQYFLFVNEVYTDVRLVGAPPSAIGKFGGDTDNWMWPRHTGDFSLFRIYADKDNKPADYSADNVPYMPLKHFPISIKGVEEGDFTMVFGYPGTTEQYVPSAHLKMITQKINPELIDIRTQKLDIIKKYQAKDPAVRIQYASKAARISNSWKRWIGEIKGLDKLDAINKKEAFEAKFQSWAKEYNNGEYINLLAEYEDIYPDYTSYRLAYNCLSETVYRNGMETVRFVGYFKKLKEAYEADSLDLDKIKNIKANLVKKTNAFFKDYYAPIDKELTTSLLKAYQQKLPKKFWPSVYQEIEKRYKNDIEKFTATLFSKTLVTDKENVLDYIENFSAKNIKKLEKDPAYRTFESFYDVYANTIYATYRAFYNDVQELNRKYMTAQIAFRENEILYPDANFTLRVSYGQVKGYEPKDGTIFKHYTTLDGIIEKDNPDIYDYKVPARLKELYAQKDFGKYEYKGSVPVCFIATNHTTGGNSGSPVVNGNGELIGVNFDRAWEGVMSDLMFNPEQCRNISLDMRYVLFLIDKFAGAGYLLDEMTIVE